MVNPNKHIRIAYRNVLSDIGVPVWTNKVPKTVKPTPTKYVLITSQTKNETEKCKDGFEWLCTVTLDITSVLNKGQSDLDILDDIEEIILTRIDEDLPVMGGFVVKSADIVESRDIDFETDSQSVERRILIYEHWLSNIDIMEDGVWDGGGFDTVFSGNIDGGTL